MLTGQRCTHGWWVLHSWTTGQRYTRTVGASQFIGSLVHFVFEFHFDDGGGGLPNFSCSLILPVLLPEGRNIQNKAHSGNKLIKKICE